MPIIPRVHAGARGPAGLPGPAGPAGPQGPAGPSINLKGTKATGGDLPTTGNIVNDAWKVNSDGNVYVWTGSAWANVGPLQGPPGPAGATGPAGASGPAGPQGPTGPAGATGPAGPQGPAGEPAGLHAAAHAVGGADPITVTVGQVEELGAQLEGKAVKAERFWDPVARTWSARPVVPANVPVRAWSTSDATASQPPGAVTGDVWNRHPDAPTV